MGTGLQLTKKIIKIKKLLPEAGGRGSSPQCPLPPIPTPLHFPLGHVQFVTHLFALQGHRVLGGIPLKDLTVIEKDINKPGVTCTLKHSQSMPSCLFSGTSTLPQVQTFTTPPQIRNRLVLVTASGKRYELEACDSNERDSWASCIRVASKLC